MGPARRVLADGWYSWHIASFRPLTDLTGRWPARIQRLAWGLGPFRALSLVLAGSRYELIAVVRQARGWRSVLLVKALLARRRNLVVLQFIDLPPRRSGLGALVDALWRPLERWAIGRALLRAQVLSAAERELYAARFGVATDRFVLIPFAWRFSPVDAPPPPHPSSRQGVVAAGRALCDWPTLFAAARAGSWPLTVICGAQDRPEVEELNRDGRAQVMVDLGREQTLDVLRRAAVCVLSLADSPVSHGHIRLCDAIESGTAVVATGISPLEGYIDPGETAITVPPGDPGAMRDAIERLLSDPAHRAAINEAAFRRAGRWTWQHYLSAVEEFVLSGTARWPTGYPPATAGRIVTSSPSETAVLSPSRKRMSSPPT